MESLSMGKSVTVNRAGLHGDHGYGKESSSQPTLVLDRTVLEENGLELPPLEERCKHAQDRMSQCLNVSPRCAFKFLVEGLLLHNLFKVNGKLQIFPSEMGMEGLFC